MRKYFTWRCIGLHVLALILVPAFLLAGWWQYEVAKGGNDLSWVYTVEWPLFAVYALYMWWKLIHDQSVPFDRLWARKQRAAAEASGTPIHQIPGWATDKELSRAVQAASLGGHAALARTRTDALEGRHQREDRAETESLESVGAATDRGVGVSPDHDTAVIEARVLGVKVERNEELDAYNRYLFELNLNNPPKQWALPRRRSRMRRPPAPGQPGSPQSTVTEEGTRPELSSGGAPEERT